MENILYKNGEKMNIKTIKLKSQIQKRYNIDNIDISYLVNKPNQFITDNLVDLTVVDIRMKIKPINNHDLNICLKNGGKEL